MAGKSQLDGAASKVYESCYGDKCDAPARKAVVISSFNEHGANDEIVPLCKSCESKAKKNAAARGLAEPKSTRLTKSLAQSYRAMHGDTEPINPHKANAERLRGERPYNSSRPHKAGQAPESMTRAWTIKINQQDPGKPGGPQPTPRAFQGDFEKDHPLVEAYQARHLEVANRRRTAEQKAAILEEARKGLKNDKRGN